MPPATAPEKPVTAVRLQKFLASAGIGSRRHCEEYIVAGRVTVDGKAVKDLGTTVDPKRQKVTLDGEIVRQQPHRYYLLNKPAGYLCTHRDQQGRPRAIDLVPQDGPRLFTVGRLDENSTGLLLVTNDGELANRLAHPRYQVPKTYRVQVAGRPTRETLAQLRKGVHFHEGKFRVRGIKYLKSQGKSTFLELVLTEGQNREIRRILARVGHKVIRLERIGFGPLRLGRLPAGKHRALKSAELKALRDFVAGEPGRADSRGKRRAGKRDTAKRSASARTATKTKRSSRPKSAAKRR